MQTSMFLRILSNGNCKELGPIVYFGRLLMWVIQLSEVVKENWNLRTIHILQIRKNGLEAFEFTFVGLLNWSFECQ